LRTRGRGANLASAGRRASARPDPAGDWAAPTTAGPTDGRCRYAHAYAPRDGTTLQDTHESDTNHDACVGSVAPCLLPGCGTVAESGSTPSRTDPAGPDRAECGGHRWPAGGPGHTVPSRPPHGPTRRVSMFGLTSSVLRLSEQRTARIVPAGRSHSDRGPLGGSGHEPPTTTNMPFWLVLARSHVVPDAPPIETCASTPRLWSELGIRDATEPSMGMRSVAKGIRTCALLVPTTVSPRSRRA
jgi:hypothetical protein